MVLLKYPQVDIVIYCHYDDNQNIVDIPVVIVCCQLLLYLPRKQSLGGRITPAIATSSSDNH